MVCKKKALDQNDSEYNSIILLIKCQYLASYNFYLTAFFIYVILIYIRIDVNYLAKVSCKSRCMIHIT